MVLVKLSANTRQRILVLDQIQLRLLCHESFLEIITPLRNFNERLAMLFKDYEKLPMIGNIVDQLVGDVNNLCKTLEAELYDAMISANANIFKTVQEGLKQEYAEIGRDIPFSAKSLPPLSTDWRKPFHPKRRIKEAVELEVGGARAKLVKAMGHGTGDSEVLSRLLNNPLETAGKFSESTKFKIRNIIVEGVNRGESTQMIAARVKQVLPRQNYNKALSIVWTETHNTMNYVKWKEYMRDPVIDYIQWITVGDRRVRFSHRRNHLQIVKKGEPFRNRQRFPGDRSAPLREWIHCRCTITPYIIEPSNAAHPRTRTPQQMVRYNAAGWKPKPSKIPTELSRAYKPELKKVVTEIKPKKPAKPAKTMPKLNKEEKQVYKHIQKGNVKIENGEVLWKQKDGSWKKAFFGWSGLEGVPKDILKLIEGTNLGIDDIEAIVKRLYKMKTGITYKEWLFNIEDGVYQSKIFKGRKTILRGPEPEKAEFKVIKNTKNKYVIYDETTDFKITIEKPKGDKFPFGQTLDEFVEKLKIEVSHIPTPLRKQLKGANFINGPRAVGGVYDKDMRMVKINLNSSEPVFGDFWHEITHAIDDMQQIVQKADDLSAWNSMKKKAAAKDVIQEETYDNFVSQTVMPAKPYTGDMKDILDERSISPYAFLSDAQKEYGHVFGELPAEFVREIRKDPLSLKKFKKRYPNTYNSLKLAAAEQGIDLDAMLESFAKLPNLYY